jgi:hypothetical protein
VRGGGRISGPAQDCQVNIGLNQINGLAPKLDTGLRNILVILNIRIRGRISGPVQDCQVEGTVQ